jgi:N-acylneuraminate cytidylyltransferase
MSERASVIAVVPVRGGSKGLPGKNVRPLAGAPLYLHAVRQGIRVAGSCVVTTNIPEIISTAAPEGCWVLERPANLGTDETPMSPVLADMIRRLKLGPEVILLLQATSPLRSDADLRAVLDLHATGIYDLVMSVTPTDSSVLKYGMIDNGRFVPVSRPGYCFSNRQSLPNVFKPNGAAYAFTAEAFLGAGGFPFKSIGAAEMPEDRSYDIDTLDDFERVERLLEQRGDGRDLRV